MGPKSSIELLENEIELASSMSSLLNIGLDHPLNEFENKSVLEFELAKNICQLLSDSIAITGLLMSHYLADRPQRAI